VINGGLEVTTLLAVIEQERVERILSLLRSTSRARIGYAIIGGEESYLGDVDVPISPVEYKFDFSRLTREDLQAIFGQRKTGTSARKLIRSVRTEHLLPDEVEKGGFLVCGMHTPSLLGEHWVLKKEHPEVHGHDGDLVHGGSVVFAATRPEIRQAELINPDGKAGVVPTFVKAGRYRAEQEQ
jgi:hypothetical protein